MMNTEVSKPSKPIVEKAILRKILDGMIDFRCIISERNPAYSAVVIVGRVFSKNLVSEYLFIGNYNCQKNRNSFYEVTSSAKVNRKLL